MELLKSLKFLEAVSYATGVLVLQFAPEYALAAGVVLGMVVTVLKLYGVQSEMKVKELLKQLQDSADKKAVKAKSTKAK